MVTPPEDRAAIIPGASQIRVVVDRADNPSCAIAVGDYFEVHDTQLHLPDGKAFCPHAISAALPIVGLRQVDLPADHWLSRKPWVCCPDATENVVLRIDPIIEGADHLAADRGTA